MVFNGTTDVMITNVAGKTPAPASFIFATLNGTSSVDAAKRIAQHHLAIEMHTRVRG